MPEQPISDGVRRRDNDDRVDGDAGGSMTGPPDDGRRGRHPRRTGQPPTRHARQDDGPDAFGRPQGDLHDPPGARRPPPRPQRRPQGRSQGRPQPEPNHRVAPDESPTEVFHVAGRTEYGDDAEYDGPDDAYGDTYDDEAYADDFFGARHEGDYDERYPQGRAGPEYVEDARRRRPVRGRRRKGGALRWVAALAVVALLALGAWLGARELLGFGYDDYDGSGDSDVVIEVSGGDSTNTIAGKLRDADVVASSKAFTKASEDNSKIRSIQPGFYAMKTRMSGTNAVSKFVDPTSRVGVLRVKAGSQLDDVTQPNGSVTDGLLTQLHKASCAPVNGANTCIPVEELRQVAETADLTELGVPQWAATDASKAEPKHRMEGLIAPGVYDVRPGMNATETINAVLRDSVARLQAAGLPDSATAAGRSPYQTLIVASLVEREGVQQDFGKIARVIYNRMEDNGRLELDSTVNYVLDRPEIRTKQEDRARAGSYNTYQNTGIPPTPISSPSKQALRAATNPDEGDWRFFVKCEKNGLSCFAASNEEHEQNRREAQARGAY